MAKWFKESEIVGLDPMLVEGLDQARERAGIPFIITEGRASTQGSHVEHSSHFKGYAVDLRCWTSWDRWKMFTALLETGFRRLGVYDKHIHVDIDPDLPQNVIWVGKSN